MTADLLLRTGIAVLPVAAFLAVLLLLDSYKLVRLGSVLRTVLVGAGVAALCLVSNRLLLEALGWQPIHYSRYGAPIVEEALKGAYVVFLVRRKKVGFMVDAAIYGFAVGTGFAIAENLVYVSALAGTNPIVWILRGFGTAIMHGGTTALVGVFLKGGVERHGSEGLRAVLPALGAAIVFHSLFNHFLLSPVLSAVILLIGLPLVTVAVFRRSEESLREWLGVGFDTDAQLLEMINTGNISESRIGRYLMALQDRFPGEVLADMLCLIRVQVELAIRAKGILLMRQAGFEVAPDPEVTERFAELRYLEKSIGKTGKLALKPCIHWTSRELWQLHMLGKR
ncbi:MAG: PrsW family glutamic-type intramembrane protease [Candidatus Eisenbacteria bacterium]